MQIELVQMDGYFTDLPYQCPKCGILGRFVSISELKHHLASHHPSLSPKSRLYYDSIGRRSPFTECLTLEAKRLEEKLRAAKEMELMNKYSYRDGDFKNHHFEMELPYMEKPHNHSYGASTEPHLEETSFVQKGAMLSDPYFNSTHKLSISMSKAQITIDKLRNEIKQKDENLEKASNELENLTLERRRLQRDILELSKVSDESIETVGELKGKVQEKSKTLKEKDQILRHNQEIIKSKEKDIEELTRFITEAADKESVARVKLEEFMESLLHRAEKAETELKQIKTGDSIRRSNSVSVRGNKPTTNGLKRSQSSVSGGNNRHQGTPQQGTDYMGARNQRTQSPLKVYTSYEQQCSHNPQEETSYKPHKNAQRKVQADYVIPEHKESPAYQGSYSFQQASYPIYTDSGLGSNSTSSGQTVDAFNSQPRMSTPKQRGYDPMNQGTFNDHEPPGDFIIDENGVMWDAGSKPQSDLNHYEQQFHPGDQLVYSAADSHGMNSPQKNDYSHPLPQPHHSQNGAIRRNIVPDEYDEIDSDSDETVAGKTTMRRNRNHRHHPSLLSQERDLIEALNVNSEKALKQQQKELIRQLRVLKRQRRELRVMRGNNTETDDVTTVTVTDTSISVTDVTTTTNNMHDDTDIEDVDFYALNEQIINQRQPSVSTNNKYSRSSPNPNKRTNNALKGQIQAAHDIAMQKRRDAMFCVFMYLDTKTLGKMALVCREWRDISRHPALWRRVKLKHTRISSKFLVTLTHWCTQLQSLTLEGLRPRQRIQSESIDVYLRNTRGCLENGLEQLFKSVQHTLISLRIIDCSNMLTQRCLWLASCYCRHLQKLAYISESDPAGYEVIWALGAGCRDLSTLIIPPMHPSQHPYRFNNRCLRLVSQCWSQLHVLCIGGVEINQKGLVNLAKNCPRLQVLELDHISEMTEETSILMCKQGLKGLEALDFTFTPVTPKSILQFISACPKLKSLSVHIGISDYFEDIQDDRNKRDYEQIVSKLKVLLKRPGVRGVLHLRTDYG
ncbi:unnamed protein product [Owenia fusiformis]|uniref:F-box domain-containing protein n=1 Tax=Owenia fusiformis TaxID=6347 RepID=A0A8S4NQP2_OWEFU|nr:unnamed protein product [Owenia fusiformis]